MDDLGLRADDREDDYDPVCDLCGQMDNLKVCGACKNAWYCCKDHQVSHWKSHKSICKSKQYSTTASGCTEGERKEEVDDPGAVSSRSESGVRAASGAGRDENSHPATITSPTYNDDLPEQTIISAENTMTKTQKRLPSQNKRRRQKMGASKREQQMDTSKPAQHTREQPSGTGEVHQKEHTKTLADYVVKCLNDYGICVVDQFLGDSRGNLIFEEVTSLHSKGHLEDGELISKSHHSKKIRGDQIRWGEIGDEGCDNIGILIQKLDKLVMTCNFKLGKYNVNGRTKAMIACYPGSGTYYMRHVDNPNEDGRCVTCIYYLNRNWDVKTDGGLLRIFPTMFPHVADIEPKFDRLLFFWSDRRNPHEVQPAYRSRFAITVWYFDAEERSRAKARHQGAEAGKDNTQPDQAVPLQPRDL